MMWTTLAGAVLLAAGSGRRHGRRHAAWSMALTFGIGCAGSSPDARDTVTDAGTVRAVGTADGARPAGCVAPRGGAWEPVPVGAARFIVNHGTMGMMATVRWALSPDSAALLVVEDPIGIENEPVPDGAFFATERTGRTWRMDSVWSVAPSPDWLQLAVGRAVVVPGGQEQVVPPTAWEAPARRLREIAGPHPALHADSLRAHSYPLSGMAVVEGAAVTMSVDVDLLPAPAARFASLDGWRVGWSCDGQAILVGDRPVHARDDGLAAATRRVAWPTGDTAGVSKAPAMQVRWATGPTILLGGRDTASMPSVARQRLTVRGRRIEGRGGRVVVHSVDRAGKAVERDVGPGIPLAATRGGRFVLALAPRENAGPTDPQDRAVVYRVP